MNKTTNILLGLLVILGVGGLWLGTGKTTQIFGGGSSIDTYDQTSVRTINFVAGQATTVAAESGTRRYFSIQNVTNVPIWCMLDGNITAASSAVSSTPAVARGMLIAPTSTANAVSPGSFYENRGYIGNVNCAAFAVATATVITSP